MAIILFLVNLERWSELSQCLQCPEKYFMSKDVQSPLPHPSPTGEWKIFTVRLSDACGCPPPRSSGKCTTDWCCYCKISGQTPQARLWADFLNNLPSSSHFVSFAQREQETSSHGSTASSRWSCTSSLWGSRCTIITSPRTSGCWRNVHEAKRDLLAGAHIRCRLPADQFGKQTYST